MDLAGKVAFVTGVRRIGSAIAVALAKGGADVAVTYRTSRQQAEDAALEVRAAGRRALVLRADLSQPRDIESVVSEAAQALGGIDVLVNVASIYGSKPVASADAADW